MRRRQYGAFNTFRYPLLNRYILLISLFGLNFALNELKRLNNGVGEFNILSNTQQPPTKIRVGQLGKIVPGLGNSATPGDSPREIWRNQLEFVNFLFGNNFAYAPFNSLAHN